MDCFASAIALLRATLARDRRQRHLASTATPHTAVITADGKRMLIFGGNNFDAVNELFAFDIAQHEWSKLKPSGTPPSKRYGHQAVITADGRMVVFGGYNGSFLDDVHELHTGTLSPSWRRIATSGTSPSARDGHSAVLAPDGYTMLVFGGFDGKNQLDDLAALDTKTFEWSHPQLLAPETVSEASEGNACGQGENDDGGGDEEFDAAPVAVPAPRYQHAAVACDHGMLVYGGYLSGGEFADDVWRLTIDEAPEDMEETEEAPLLRVRWVEVRTTGDRPGGSFGHAAAAIPGGKHMWVSGGFGCGDARSKTGGSFSSALHVLDLEMSRWRRVQAPGVRPSPRHKHTMIATRRGTLLLFGGNDFGPTRGLYEFNATLALSAANAPVRRALTAMVACIAQVLQLLALFLLGAAAWLRQLAFVNGSRCLVALVLATIWIFGAETAAPPPGGFIARLRRKPKQSSTNRRNRLAAAEFERSALSSAVDVAAAMAAAGVVSLLASGGGLRRKGAFT